MDEDDEPFFLGNRSGPDSHRPLVCTETAISTRPWSSCRLFNLRHYRLPLGCSTTRVWQKHIRYQVALHSIINDGGEATDSMRGMTAAQERQQERSDSITLTTTALTYRQQNSPVFTSLLYSRSLIPSSAFDANYSSFFCVVLASGVE